jgi:Fe-S cluster biogenesis protein NfuA
VLSLHDVHPVALEERVLAALERARGYLHSHGGDVELDAIEDGVVRVTLSGTCGSCASSITTMTTIVEDAIYSVAPEVRTVIAEKAPTQGQSNLVTLHIH